MEKWRGEGIGGEMNKGKEGEGWIGDKGEGEEGGGLGERKRE